MLVKKYQCIYVPRLNEPSKSPLPGANPTIASYDASVVNFKHAIGSLVRF
jgi:hypothetical protein